jgi:membrane-bound lytic murein transglycosylase D
MSTAVSVECVSPQPVSKAMESSTLFCQAQKRISRSIMLVLMMFLSACETFMPREASTTSAEKTVAAEVAKPNPAPPPKADANGPAKSQAAVAASRGAKTPAPAPEKTELAAIDVAKPAVPIVEDFWAELVASRRFTDCNYDPAIESWAKRLSASPANFNANAIRILPYLDFVWRRVRELDMPAEVAFLPLVESDYRQVYGSYGSPGGWWQIMPATGKHFRLDVSRKNDERVDPVKATKVAIALMQENANRFQQDWLVSIFAYNVGGLRVQRAMEAKGLIAGQIEHVSQLGLPQITSDHLHRMIAWGCIFADPKRYGVTLPPGLNEAEQFTEMRITQTTPLTAMTLSLGRFGDEWKRQHPLVTKRGEVRYGQLVLAPKTINAQIASLGKLRNYRTPVIAQTAAPAKSSVPATTTARRTASKTQSSARLNTARKTARTVQAAPAQYKVRNGDNLWTIARRFDMRVKEILTLNPAVSRDRLLKLGQVLKLR